MAHYILISSFLSLIPHSAIPQFRSEFRRSAIQIGRGMRKGIGRRMERGVESGERKTETNRESNRESKADKNAGRNAERNRERNGERGDEMNRWVDVTSREGRPFGIIVHFYPGEVGRLVCVVLDPAPTRASRSSRSFIVSFKCPGTDPLRGKRHGQIEECHHAAGISRIPVYVNLLLQFGNFDLSWSGEKFGLGIRRFQWAYTSIFSK
jgi:hypothetical protein